MKIDFLRSFTVEQFYQLEYRNEEEYQKLKPSTSYVKEVPYIKNNPREKEIAGDGAKA